MPVSSVYSKTVLIPQSVIDENGHVHNVTYVRRMQEIAVEHYQIMSGINSMGSYGPTWVVREHKIEYLLSAFVEEEIKHAWKTFAGYGHCANANLSGNQTARSWSGVKQIGCLWI
jgi:hypothetical protein